MKKTSNNFKSYKFIGYLWVIIAGAALFLPNYLLIPYLHSNKSCPLLPFCNSVSTPWGAFTSLFIFDGWTNLYAFIIWFSFLFLLTVFMSQALFKVYTKTIALALFPISIISNGIVIVVNAIHGLTLPDYGASTFVYVFLGLLFGLSASITIFGLDKHSWNNAVFLVNIAFLCIISVFVLFLSSVIFSIAPHIDYIVHEIAFLLGTIFMLVYSKLVIFRKRYLYNAMASH